MTDSLLDITLRVFFPFGQHEHEELPTVGQGALLQRGAGGCPGKAAHQHGEESAGRQMAPGDSDGHQGHAEASERE